MSDDAPASGGGKGAMALLTRKVGGVPVWAGALVLGLGLGIYLRHKSAGAVPVDTTPADTTTDGGSDNPGDGTTVFASQTDPGNIAPSTNTQWISLGVRILVGLGYDGPTAQSALTHYTAGMPTTTDELALVSIVQAAIGAPPQAIPISTTGGGGFIPPRPPITVGPTPYPPGSVPKGPPWPAGWDPIRKRWLPGYPRPVVQHTPATAPAVHAVPTSGLGAVVR